MVSNEDGCGNGRIQHEFLNAGYFRISVDVKNLLQSTTECQQTWFHDRSAIVDG